MVRFFGGVLPSLMGCFPLSTMALGFSPFEQERRCEVMEVYASGFAGYPEGYFISCESALGVMTGWRALLEYQAAWFSSRMRRVFIEQCLCSRIEDFFGFCAKGQEFLRVRLRESSRICSKTVKFAFTSRRESSQYKHRS
jgi:hypothetical protein